MFNNAYQRNYPLIVLSVVLSRLHNVTSEPLETSPTLASRLFGNATKIKAAHCNLCYYSLLIFSLLLYIINLKPDSSERNCRRVNFTLSIAEGNYQFERKVHYNLTAFFNLNFKTI